MTEEEEANKAFEEGVSLFQGEKYAEAIEAFNRSLELRPDYPATLNNRGITHGRMGNHDLALAAYNRSLELRPGDPRYTECARCSQVSNRRHSKRPD